MECPKCGGIVFYHENKWLPDIEYIKNMKMYSLEELENMGKEEIKRVNYIPFKLYKKTCARCNYHIE